MRTVAYLGNSVTAQRASYVDPLHQLVSSHWGLEGQPLRAGLGGVGSLALAGLLDYLILRHSPGMCFVECSLADAGGATPVKLIATGLDSILGDLREASITPVVLHLPRADIPAEVHQAVVDVYDAVATAHGVRQIDVRHLADHEGLHDGVHTSSALSELIASEISVKLGPEPPGGDLPTGLRGSSRVRLLPASSGTTVRGSSRTSTFRFSLETTTVDAGGALHFEAPGARYLGVYVIARSTSGVIRVQGGDQSSTIQVWDEWCSRPRIQFIHLPENLSPGPGLEVWATDLVTGDRNAQGAPTGLSHRGSSVEILGAAIQISGDHGRD